MRRYMRIMSVIILAILYFGYRFLSQSVPSSAISSTLPSSPMAPKNLINRLNQPSDQIHASHTNRSWWTALQNIPIWNNELEHYKAANVRILNGNLTLVTTSNYDSGAVISKPFLYGMVSVDAKLPYGQGIFPAIWLRPANGGIYPEVDIMEHIGSEPNVVYGVLHYASNGKTYNPYFKQQGSFNKGFHTFKLLWTPNELIWYIDGERVFKLVHNIPHQPMYLRINTALGGNWAQAPNTRTVFPQYFILKKVLIPPLYYKKRNTLYIPTKIHPSS